MNTSQEFDDRYRSRFERMATTNLSDAMDKIGIRGAVIGIRPMFDCPKVVGRAVTIKVTAAGLIRPKYHMAVRAIDSAAAGDVIVVDNRGDLHNNCWGEIVAMGAKMKGVQGAVVDGAVRDIDACRDFGFPVFARGAVPVSARGRVMEESFNEAIRIGDVQVRPGDIVMADANGVVVVPVEQLDGVLTAADEIVKREAAMVDELRRGVSILEVDQKYAYEIMLTR